MCFPLIAVPSHPSQGPSYGCQKHGRLLMSGYCSVGFLLFCGAFATVHTAPLVRRQGCKPSCLPSCPQSSQTGVPCLPSVLDWPYTTQRDWSSKLGERIVKAATPTVSKETCGDFKLFGDSAWCLAAFNATDVIGLSFGIEERDLWSETMSNVFHMPTELYDCFQDPSASPPLSLKAPNAEGSCLHTAHHCYETAYKAFRVCLGPTIGMVDGREYTSLPVLLKDRPPLAVHVKMDVEGSEWSVLENLTSTDFARIRTIDAELHFGFLAASEATYRNWPVSERVRREVEIFERLLKSFAVVGSNLETNAEGWQPANGQGLQGKKEQPVVHTAGGFPVNQFAISFVNRKLLSRNLGAAVSAAGAVSF